jgi:hypothetical protein
MVSVPPMKRWAALVLVLVVSGCGGKNSASIVPAGPAPTPTKGAAPWPAPPNPMALTRKAGLTPETHEFVFLHVHAHLDIYVNGEAVTVPAAIGINIHDPAVKRIQEADGSVAYGGISPPCARVCISPLHTHDTTGILHTEAKKDEFNDLGQFFTEWKVRLGANCVGGYCRPTAPITVYVDGDVYTGNPRQIQLEDRREIAIVIGTPPDSIPSRF